MKICITQEDIDNGKPMSPSSCPLALALGRKYICIVVCSDTVQFVYKDRARVYKTKRKARDFICAFDDYKEVKPCRVRLKRI